MPNPNVCLTKVTFDLMEKKNQNFDFSLSESDLIDCPESH